MTDVDERVSVAERAARAGAEVALEGFRAELRVERKARPTDLVTQRDRDAQRRVLAAIEDAFPGEPVVGEEADARKTVPGEGPAWVVDPIDGTSNYVRGLQVWGTAVAAVLDGEPVAGATVMPALGDVFVAGPDGVERNGEPVAVSERDDPEAFTVVPTFWWDRERREEYARATRAIVERFGDLRRFGSSQATLAWLASGGVEGVVSNLRGHPWDSLAGVRMVRAAGGTVTDLAGERWRHDDDGLVASNGRRHEAVLAAAREIERDGDDG